MSLAPGEKFFYFTFVFCSEHVYAIVAQCVRCDYSFVIGSFNLCGGSTLVFLPEYVIIIIIIITWLVSGFMWGIYLGVPT